MGTVAHEAEERQNKEQFMKIVVLDGYTLNPGDISWEGLEALGDLTVYDRTPQEQIAQRIEGAEVVLTNKTPLTRSLFEQVRSIRFVGVLATGYNVVDIAAASEYGVVVTNIPTYGTAAVAQFAIALLLEVCHHIGHHHATVQAGVWTRCPDFCYWEHPLIELDGKTMGIIGFGRIGQHTARIAAALGMQILAYDAYRDPQMSLAGCRYAGLEELLESSDVISLHAPLVPETEGIINSGSIARMKDGVILINNSRGALIVEEDLKEALLSGKVAAAGLDVVSSEPIRADNPLLGLENCIITPHISWAPKESRMRLMAIAVENVRAFVQQAPLQNVVNPL
jgi:glycerate dehydrogenase